MLVVGDVVGHGVWAARRAAFTRTTFAATAAFSAVLAGLQQPSPTEAISVLRSRVAEFAYGALTDDLCVLAARID